MTSLPVIQPPLRSAVPLDQLARRMRLRGESALRPLGLRPRHLVTLSVLQEQGEVTQQALAASLQLDSTNVVGVLNELESDGLVTRRRDANDRRRHIVELTEAGRERLAQAEFALAAVEDDVLRALDPDQRRQLAELLHVAAAGCLAADYAATCLPPHES